jgi:hypothetical protein
MTPDTPRRRQPLSDAMAAAGFLAIAILAVTQIIAGVALLVMWSLLVFGLLAGAYYTMVAVRGFRAGIDERRKKGD